jgi:formylglycine-generating enzyme required for sulfatase activity/energy-coupling factor transporter ATP-binding protein EcfA2
MDDENKKDEPKIQADNNSIAVGNISAGGNIGDININTGYTVSQVSILITQIRSTFQPKPFDGRCPYKGLDVFVEEDAELFFGREQWVENLLGRVKESRTLFVTGQSGSGKSSLVRAGLIPALKKTGYGEHWLYATMKPGRDPIDTLANAFSRLKDPSLAKYLRENAELANVLHECAESALSERADQRLVLFIDQFEEVFTQLSKDKAQVFINLLDHAATVENGRVIVLFSMRSDFIPNCAIYPQLNAILNQQFIQIGAMQSDELVSAIAQPALRVGLKIDPELIAQIINDMKGEPGALPLMQFALKDLFDAEKAKGGIIALTLSDYLRRGGIDEALERHANASLDELTDEEKELARSVFSGLIEIGRSTQDTRRTALSNELIPADKKADAVKSVVQKLANARLITTDATTVTISHEKLIDAWPWLKKLVNENRDVIALQNEIAEDAKEWHEHGQDESYLYTGARLANANEKLDAKKLILSGLSQAFVAAGIKMEETEQRKKEQQQQRELEAARAQAKAERQARLRTIGMLAIAVVLVIVLSIDPIKRELLRRQALGPQLVEFTNPDGKLGDPRWSENPDEVFYFYPEKSYSLSAFAIEPEPTTNKRYLKCVDAGKCSLPSEDPSIYLGNADIPVVQVTAFQASQFCAWLGRRLPTDKEWEQAGLSTDLYEWTSTSFDYDWHHPESTIEWTDISKSPPARLSIKGGSSQPDQISFRNEQTAFYINDSTGFRCAINR